MTTTAKGQSKTLLWKALAKGYWKTELPSKVYLPQAQWEKKGDEIRSKETSKQQCEWCGAISDKSLASPHDPLLSLLSVTVTVLVRVMIELRQVSKILYIHVHIMSDTMPIFILPDNLGLMTSAQRAATARYVINSKRELSSFTRSFSSSSSGHSPSSEHCRFLANGV